ncbi:MAG: cobalt ABC transporter permease [Chthoniobacteraceae bacterium]
MKKVALTWALLLALALGIAIWLSRMPHTWAGVDETVVEKYAVEAGRPPRKPFINTDQGDLLLFVFLIAGTAAGFMGGYFFRALFPPAVKQ